MIEACGLVTLCCSVDSCAVVYQVYGRPTEDELAEPLCPTHKKARLATPENGCDEIGTERN